MASAHLVDFQAKLQDFDEIIAARDSICPSGAGRPAKRQGAAVIRGGVVLLSAAFEAYVEDVFDDLVDLLYHGRSNRERRDLKSNTSGRLNNASVWKVDLLYASVGLPWIMNDPTFRWQKFSNETVCETLNDLISARNKISHRGVWTVRRATAIKWRNFLERLTEKFDLKTSAHVQSVTGTAPW